MSWSACRRVHGLQGVSSAVQVASSQLPLEELQSKLDIAVAHEDYETAAALRDELTHRRHDSRVAVEEANRRFYAAMQSADLAAMQQIWGHGQHVQCIHPVSNCLAGREDVSGRFIPCLSACCIADVLTERKRNDCIAAQWLFSVTCAISLVA